MAQDTQPEEKTPINHTQAGSTETSSDTAISEDVRDRSEAIDDGGDSAVEPSSDRLGQSNLIGKINNLVSTDLGNVGGGGGFELYPQV